MTNDVNGGRDSYITVPEETKIMLRGIFMTGNRVDRKSSIHPISDSSQQNTLDRSASRPNHEIMTDLTRQEIDAKLAQNKAEVDARLANFDTSIKTGFADLRAEFAALRTEIADGRTEAAKQSHESMKWVIGTVFTTISLGVAIIGMFINLSKSDKSSPPAAQPAPIIITIPAGGAIATPAPQPPMAATK